MFLLPILFADLQLLISINVREDLQIGTARSIYFLYLRNDWSRLSALPFLDRIWYSGFRELFKIADDPPRFSHSSSWEPVTTFTEFISTGTVALFESRASRWQETPSAASYADWVWVQVARVVLSSFVHFYGVETVDSGNSDGGDDSDHGDDSNDSGASDDGTDSDSFQCGAPGHFPDNRNGEGAPDSSVSEFSDIDDGDDATESSIADFSDDGDVIDEGNADDSDDDDLISILDEPVSWLVHSDRARHISHRVAASDDDQREALPPLRVPICVPSVFSDTLAPTTQPPGAQRVLHALLSGRVRPQTAQATASRGLAVFSPYLQNVYGWTENTILSSDVWTDPHLLSDKRLLDILMVYTFYLSRYVIKGTVKSGVHRYFQALADEALLAGRQRLHDFTRHRLVMHARNKVAANGVTPRERSRKRLQSRSLPVSNAMLKSMLVKFEQALPLLLGQVTASTKDHFDAIDESFAFVAGLVQLQFAVRASNLLKSESDAVAAASHANLQVPQEDLLSLDSPQPPTSPAPPDDATGESGSEVKVSDVHPVMCQDVKFWIKHVGWVSAFDLRLHWEALFADFRADAVDFVFHTSKTNQTGSAAMERTVHVNNYGSNVFCQALLSIACAAHYDEATDMFFSRRCTKRWQGKELRTHESSRKRITANALRSFVKRVAAQSNPPLNPANFGTKSFKLSAISFMQDAHGGLISTLNRLQTRDLSVIRAVANNCGHASVSSNVRYYREDPGNVAHALDTLAPDNSSSLFSHDSLVQLAEIRNSEEIQAVPISRKRRITPTLVSSTTRNHTDTDDELLDGVELCRRRLENVANRAARGTSLEPRLREAVVRGDRTPSPSSDSSAQSTFSERARVRELQEQRRRDQSHVTRRANIRKRSARRALIAARLAREAARRAAAHTVSLRGTQATQPAGGVIAPGSLPPPAQPPRQAGGGELNRPSGLNRRV